MKRRTFISSIAAAGTVPALATAAAAGKNGGKSSGTTLEDIRVLSPPVVQNPTETSFSVAWMVSGMATGWVEWGSSEKLGNIAKPAHHGLMSMSEYALSARVAGIPQIPAGAKIFYRVVTMPVHYKNAYTLEQGNPILGEIRQIHLPQASAASCSLVMVNDTHDHNETIQALATRIDSLNPDALIWNGDAANTFGTPRQMACICLTPGQNSDDPAGGGWASTRPLLFTLGNHDVRGQSARTMPEALTPWPLDAGDPAGLAPAPYVSGRYCFAKRIGPVAMICLDTGEDKPDARAVFGGMAAYEPYREAQREWLLKVLKQPEITSAPYLITFCHIPLRGLKGDNDGTGETGYCAYSGFGRKLWMKALVDAGCQIIFSGHTHRHRIDTPTTRFPLHQVVGGGPDIKSASLICIDANQKELRVIVENLEQKEVGKVILQPRIP